MALNRLLSLLMPTGELDDSGEMTFCDDGDSPGIPIC